MINVRRIGTGRDGCPAVLLAVILSQGCGEVEGAVTRPSLVRERASEPKVA